MKFPTQTVGLISALTVIMQAAPAMAKDGVSTGTDGITLRTGELELTLGGRLHLDALTYDDDAMSFTDADIRRARIELSGQFGSAIRFRVDREFAGNSGWRNLWASVRPTKSVEIKGGHFTVPFSMEDIQSSNSTQFVERSLATALAPGFGLGGGASISKSRWTASVGYFGDALANDEGQSKERGRGFAGRVTVLPISSKNQFLHLGLSAEQRKFNNGDVVQFQTTPGASLAPNLLQTGPIGAVDKMTNFGAELAYSRGPILVQGQYINARVNRDLAPTLNFNGWYAQASWLVTGRSYDYSKRSGVVSGPDIKRGKGAVELALRYSGLDLNDQQFSRGTARTTTLGANWYIRSNLRLMGNYIHATSKDVLNTADKKADLGVVRLQVNF